MGFWGIVLAVLAVSVAGGYLALFAVAVVQIARDRTMSVSVRAAWLVTIVGLPIGGSIAWLAVGHRTKEFEQPA
ncbi:PLDc N-terminal domain-containing protein [Leifsonia sp. NPDC058248]|uniref:PLDc N-terminal domain-containing protein n=1 Tax=Leifsonia sp. NPDC058248 TaxID=3346402 RepID=UPI0036D7C2C5